MTVSKYFRHTDSPNEAGLVDSLTKESIKLRGINVYYVPRNEEFIDYLFGEDKQSSFGEHYIIEMTLPDNVEGFAGEGDFMSRFGMDIRDECTFQVSKTRFEYEITRKNPAIIRPREGDLIVFPLNKIIFEITFVEHEQPFYIIGQLPVYEMITKRFQYTHEPMDTGITEVDDLPDKPEFSDSDNLDTEDDTISDWSETDPFSDHS